MRIKWLHLSDIHFSYDSAKSRLLRMDILKRVRSLAEDEQFSHLILSGDILDKNDMGDAKATGTVKFIRDLIEAMQIHIDNVIMVPGNHDHNRNTANQLVESIYKDPADRINKVASLNTEATALLLSTFSNFDTLHISLFEEEYYVDNSNPHMISIKGGINVVRLNTAWLDVASTDSESQICGWGQLLSVLENNESTLQQTSSVNIAVGHHPLESLADQKDILNLFHKFNIGLYFCGHKHQSSITYLQEKDVLQLTCGGSFYDGYSVGGYIYGVIDTDCNLYKAEFFKWNEDSWYIESTLQGTDSRGTYYFQTGRYRHNAKAVAADFSIMGPHVARRELARSLNTEAFDTLIYPYSNIDVSTMNRQEDWERHRKQIQDFATSIKHLREKGNEVHLYPMAPIPMLLTLGYELQKNCKLHVHQHDQDSLSWVYNEKADNTDCTIELTQRSKMNLVLKISCSFVVRDEQIQAALPNTEYDIMSVTTSNIKAGYPLYSKDVLRVVKKIRDELNGIVAQYHNIHIFAAIPAGMAVELGRTFLQSVYSNVWTYQWQQNRYIKALVINPVQQPNEQGLRLDNNVFSIEEYKQNVVQVPILGEIACGTISDAIRDSDEYYAIPSYVLGSGEHFIVKAAGDSMIGAGIDDGDLVIVRRQDTAHNGQIVVARDENSTTLKRMLLDDKRKKIVLRAENPSYEDQEFDDIDIQGVAVQVIKRLK